MSKGGGSFSSGGTTVNFNKFDRRTDGGWIGSTGIAQAALIAVAGINTAAAISMNNKQVEIARGHLDLARQLQGYFFGTYRPREVIAVAEAFAEPKYTPKYISMSQNMIAQALYPFTMNYLLSSTLGRYCTSMSADMDRELANTRMLYAIDSTNFAYRYEENRKDAKDAVRWDHMMQSLGLGRNLIKDSLAYSRAAEGTFAQVADAAGKAAGSALQGLGYFMGRNNTKTPQNTYQGKDSAGNSTQLYGNADFDNPTMGYTHKLTGPGGLQGDLTNVVESGVGGAAAGNSGS